MNKKLIHGFRTNLVLSSIALVVFSLVAFAFSPFLALAEMVATIVVILVGVRRNKMAKRSVRQYMDRVGGSMDTARSSNMLYAPLAMMVFDISNEEILWANDTFVNLTEQKENVFEASVSDVVPDFSIEWLKEGKRECPTVITWNHRIFRVFGAISNSQDMTVEATPLATTYWMEITEEEEMRQTLEMTKPVLAVLMVDNYDELMSNCPDNKKSQVIVEIEEKIHNWADSSHGLVLSYTRDRSLFLFEEKDYIAFEDKKFEILDAIHSVEVGGICATLSVGIGRDAPDFESLFKNANIALEMALSRGGDQAVVKDSKNFEFYGGKSKSTEKRTKVKSRVMATALSELMEDSKHIYVMGHKYADMDCAAAALGIVSIARKLGKKIQIVMDTENNAAHPILRSIENLPQYNNLFVSGDTAFLHAQSDTLLIVVDTNRPESVESPALLDSCSRVVVIDHHRRGNSYIEKMALNFHEPHASSASEMVTELMMYLVDKGDILKEEADALLSGIVLDTKNFTNRTSSRTFEAAAFLKNNGADTQDVQRMFQGDLQSMITRYDIIRKAEIYHNDMAIVFSEDELERVTAAKAADELLTLKGIRASFVIYKKGNGVYMSARSLGEVNVQLILESLGGGGNSTTAGGQAENITVEEAKEKLLKAIEDYYKE